MRIQLRINEKIYDLTVKPQETLLDVLRDKIGLIGTKKGCETGECGACTVLIDKKAVNSCLVLAVTAQGKEILTIEGLGKSDKLHPLQSAFINYGAIQCGFCTPGMILTAKSLIDRKTDLSREEVLRYMSGNLCRCTGYVKIVDAIMSVVEKKF